MHQLLRRRPPFPKGKCERHIVDEEQHSFTKLIDTAKLVLERADDSLRLQPKDPMGPDDPRGVKHSPVVTAKEILWDFAERSGGLETSPSNSFPTRSSPS